MTSHLRYSITQEIDTAGHPYIKRSSTQHECPICHEARRKLSHNANQRRYDEVRKLKRQAEIKTSDIEQVQRETIHKKCAPETCPKYYAQCEAIVMTGAAIPCIPFTITPRPRADGMQDRSIVVGARMVEAGI
jgi:hypothetical protein